MALIGTMKYLTIGDKTYEIAGDELQIASASTLGGIKVGSGLSIDATTGVLSTSITETDPTVPSWAKASTKPTYTYSEVGAAASSHTHGNITNGGDITAIAPTIANGDQIIINDNSASKITNGPTFDGSTTTTALTPKGTWENFSKFSGSYNDLSNKPTIPTVPTVVSAFTNDAGYITSADVPEGASAYTGTISAVSTTASNGTNNGFARGDHVHNITSSTITSALGYTPYDNTNPNGYISSYTDEKLKWTASTTSNTYYPLQSTSTATTSTANTLNGISFYQYYNTAGGYRRLDLGNTTAYKSTGGAYGTIRLYGAAATYYGDLVPGVLGTTSGDGHISANRTWTLPDATGTIALTSDIPTSTGSSTTGISITDHSTTSIYGVSSSTTSVTGVSGSTSVYGVKSGTNSTTTASYASGGNGSASSWTFEEKTIPNVTSAGSASSWTFEEKTIPNVTSAGSASSWTFEEKSIPNVTAAGSGSASLTFTMDTTDTKKLKIAFSHTHTAPTIGTAIKVQSKSGGSNGTAPTLGTAIKVQSKSGGSNGTAPTLGTAIKVQSKSGGSNGTAPTWSFTDVTVPIRADSATTVPTAASSATTVPIKNSSSTTVVTGKSHTITDNGHTHTI